MSDTVIRVEQLAKRYRLGMREKKLQGFGQTVQGIVVSPFKYLRSVMREPEPEEIYWALKDISFEVKQGDVVGIIGRNGAGKSTLLKILSRITEPTLGYAEIRGRVGSLLEVGTGFHPDLTGRENTYLNGTILGMTKREINLRFDEIVAFAEVEKFIDTPVKFYSSGMYTRLAFAVAVHLQPEILIMDEVLAVGDAAFQKKCLTKMKEVASEGKTILFVSHNMGSVSALCNKAIYLSKSKIQMQGETEKIVKAFYSEVVRNDTQNLAELRLPGYGEKIRFLDIEMLSSKDRILEFGKPISYGVTIGSSVDMEGLSIGSSFFGSNGNCVGSLISSDFSIKANSRLSLELVVSNLNLAPDSYHSGFSIGFGQQEGNRTDFDIVIGKPVFDIVPRQDSEFNIANWSTSWGNIAFKDVSLKVKDYEMVKLT
jgi:lipopolysaccharide transport system ATP-binding protein